jgi:hypothetical protein
VSTLAKHALTCDKADVFEFLYDKWMAILFWHGNNGESASDREFLTFMTWTPSVEKEIFVSFLMSDPMRIAFVKTRQRLKVLVDTIAGIIERDRDELLQYFLRFSALKSKDMTEGPGQFILTSKHIEELSWSAFRNGSLKCLNILSDTFPEKVGSIVASSNFLSKWLSKILESSQTHITRGGFVQIWNMVSAKEQEVFLEKMQSNPSEVVSAIFNRYHVPLLEALHDVGIPLRVEYASSFSSPSLLKPSKKIDTLFFLGTSGQAEVFNFICANPGTVDLLFHSAQ